jgi:hypothetical protein
MLMLRLGNSVDALSPTVPDELRSYRLVERMFTDATGEPADTILKRIAPRPALPAIIDRWIREYQPDAIFLILSQFWYGYASAPKKVEKLGGPGYWLARAGYKAAAVPWIARSPLFHGLRRFARKTIGASYIYEPEQVVASMRECITFIREKHPRVAIAVWSENTDVVHGDDARLGRELHDRRVRVHGPLRTFCEQLDIPHYILDEPDIPNDVQRMREKDNIHPNALGHEYIARVQLPLVLELWERVKALRGAAV